MRAPSPSAPRTGAFWFGIQMIWGALLGISLQARSAELAPRGALIGYAALAIGGAAVAAVTQIFVGIVSDRRRARGGRRIEFYLTGAAAGAIAVVWFYLAPSYTQLVAALLLLQCGLNVAIGPYQAAIPDFFEPRALGAASGWMAGLQSLGNMAGALLVTFVKQGAIVGATLGGVLLATCALTGMHVRSLELVRGRSERLQITTVFADLFVSRLFVYAGFYTLLGYLFFYVSSTLGGDAKTQTGMLLLFFLVASAIGAALAVKPVDTFDRRTVAAFGGVIFIAALAAFVLSHGVVAIIIATLAAGIGWGVFLTADWTLGCMFLPQGAIATAMAIWNLSLLVPQIAAPLIVTMIAAALHELQTPQAPVTAFILAAVEVAVGLAWLRRLPASRAVAA